MSLPRFSVENPVPVNILMFLIIAGGLFYAFNLVRELFPETKPNRVTITTTYKGSSPLEVEKAITIKIEDKVKDLEGIDTMYSSSTEYGSVVNLKLEDGFREINRLLNEVKGEVDKITDFPEDADEPNIRLAKPLLPVIGFSVHGEVGDDRLKRIGQKVKEEVLRLPGVTNALVTGAGRREIAVEISPQSLVRYHLSFNEVYQAISRSNMDLAAGKLRSSDTEILVRTVGEGYTAEDIGAIVVRKTDHGNVIYLRQVATIRDGFEEDRERERFEGESAVTVTVYKTPEQDAIDIADRVKVYVEQLRRDLPHDLKVGIHSDLSNYIRQRLDLLNRNGSLGLILVFISLVLFLNSIIAFWTAMGLIISFLGTFIIMYLTGTTINLMSMFGLIVVLGMLVDDAIIIAENIYRHVEEGKSAEIGAIEGANEVAMPVTVAILTTVSAFLPLLLMKGEMGQLMKVLPVVVTCALAVSLFEALVILPSHLAEYIDPVKVRHSLSLTSEETAALPWWRRWRLKQLYYLNVAGREYLGRALEFLLPRRYVVVFATICVTVIVVVAGAIFVPFVVIQKLDSDTIAININMPVGTPIEKTQEVVKQIEPYCLALPEKKHINTLVGVQVAFTPSGLTSSGPSADKAQVYIEFVDPEKRERDAFQIITHLREKLAHITGPESIKFENVSGGPAGQDIEIEVQGHDLNRLKEAAENLKTRLRRFEGVHDIQDNFQMGKKEIKIRLNQLGRGLGLTEEQVATQVRASIFGLEADKFYRDRDEVVVMVRYPKSHRRGQWDIENMRISTPQGGMVYLREVADIEMGKAYVAIERTDQFRTVTVSADVNYEKNTPTKIIAQMIEEDIPEVQREFPLVTTKFKGAKLEAQRSIGSLLMSFAIALILIYSLLAGQFKSYLQPLVVMFAIPFAVIGAILGHIVLDYELTLLSLVGIVALSGIVVNDSLVLVDFINQRVRAGGELLASVIESSKLRMRPILLTSITTILGLGPMMLETSMQARFLIPMAISITFGLAFATFLTLVIVPCLYLIVTDVKWFTHLAWQRLWTGEWPEEEEPQAVPSPGEVEETSKEGDRDS